MSQADNTILPVKKVFKDGPGDWACICPHCGGRVNFPDGPIKGEQFQHSNDPKCLGWFDVSSDFPGNLP